MRTLSVLRRSNHGNGAVVMRNSCRLFRILLIILGFTTLSYGFLRHPLSEKEVVTRAKYIVIGKIRKSSLIRINHENRSYEYHVDLMISEVLKGQIASNSIVVSIHYGLDPVVGPLMLDKTASKDAVKLWDGGNSLQSGWPISGDIRHNQIWLLHREKNSPLDPSDWIGIYSPEDIQPLDKKEELLECLKSKSELVNELRRDELSSDGKGAIIYLLGTLHCNDADFIEVLIKNIDLKSTKSDSITGVRRWGPYPAQEELEKIGKLALNPVLQRLSRETDKLRRHLLCEVLVGIYGKNEVGLKIAKEQIRARLAAEPNPNKAANLAAALGEVESSKVQ